MQRGPDLLVYTSLSVALQQIQNIAARYVTLAQKYDHITPILVQLLWLPVSYRIVFKHLLSTNHWMSSVHNI